MFNVTIVVCRILVSMTAGYMRIVFYVVVVDANSYIRVGLIDFYLIVVN